MIYLLMGVMGCGKTTVGAELARRLGCPFHDGDDYHSEGNRRKMSQGIPLTDEDRKPWIFALRAVIDSEMARGGDFVLACSALRERYRKVLISDPARVRLVHLKGSRELIASRLRARKGSFADPSLLDSQFETLEEPSDALTVDVSLPVDRIVERILTP
jgi:gluconokinase